MNLHLIDFGCATKFLLENSEHIEEEGNVAFHGNTKFASSNQLRFQRTSRRDDLMSLCYLLVYLFNDGKLLKDLSLVVHE